MKIQLVCSRRIWFFSGGNGCCEVPSENCDGLYKKDSNETSNDDAQDASVTSLYDDIIKYVHFFPIYED